MCAKKFAFEPDYAIAPGETVREVMESLGMTQKEFAMRLDTTVQTLNRIFKAEQSITVEMANKLERVTGVPSSFWNNLESQYRTQLARVREAEEFKAQREWLKKIPVSELEKRGYISKALSFEKKFDAVLGFFGVSSVVAWENTWAKPAVAARRSQCFDRVPHLAATWIRMGELEAQKVACGPTDIKKFRAAMPELRKLTKEYPAVFLPKMKEICKNCGVVLVLVPEFPRLAWHGATKWIGDTAIIILNLRGKKEDKFWFSFFHEAGHVIKHSKLDFFINDGDKEDQREKEANDFAQFVLFDKKRDMIAKLRSKEELSAFAEDLGISSGLVAGQYQFITKRYNIYNGLIRHFDWTSG